MGFYMCFSSHVVHMWIICKSHVIVPVPHVKHICIFHKGFDFLKIEPQFEMRLSRACSLDYIRQTANRARQITACKRTLTRLDYTTSHILRTEFRETYVENQLPVFVDVSPPNTVSRHPQIELSSLTRPTSLYAE